MSTNTTDQFKTVGSFDIGGISHQDLIEKAKLIDICCTDWGKEILTETKNLPKRIFSVEIVSVILRIDLPKKDKSKKLRPMYNEAIESGLCLCPPSVALEILIQTLPGKIGEKFLAMNPVPCTCMYGDRKQKNIISITDRYTEHSKARIVNGTPGALDEFADGGMTYLFCRQHPELIKAGFTRIE